MPSVELFDLADDELEAMPLSAVALLVMANFERFGGWNERNWMVERQNADASPRALAVYAEAWAWLHAKALVMKHPTQDSANGAMLTRAGRLVLKEGLGRLRAMERLDLDLHPRIATTVREQFLLGEYELATIAALREVEIAVREAAGLANADIGVKLMRKAFGGPLRDPSAEPSEHEATRELFAGAFGVFRNPVSHRQVNYDDVVFAAEVILLADLLLRVLDRTVASIILPGGGATDAELA